MNRFCVKTIFPPNYLKNEIDQKKTIRLFLAGSIEQGKAEEWQKRIINFLINFKDGSDSSIKEEEKTTLVVFNPRRPDWNPGLPQDVLNATLKEQIMWELKYLDESDIICLYLDPKTTSPVSLLELGLHIKTGKLLVCCPPGFYRKANIDLTCNKYGVNVYEDYDTLCTQLSEKILCEIRKQ